MDEPPNGSIRYRLMSGKMLPFLRAGASFVRRAAPASWNPSQPTFLPGGKELSRFLATETSFPSTQVPDRDDLAQVSSCLNVSGRGVLCDQLRHVLAHDFLASFPAPFAGVSMIYDPLIEQAFFAAGRPTDLVIDPAGCKDIANAYYSLSDQNLRVIFKDLIKITFERGAYG